MRARAHADVVELTLSDEECAVLVHLCDEVVRALAEDPSAEPRRRLLPDAYPDDAQASAEFRRYTLDGLVSAKVTDVQAVQAAVRTAAAERGRGIRRGTIAVLSRSALPGWLRGLTSIRLVLAAHLGEFDGVAPAERDGIGETRAAERDDDLDTRALYDWVGYLQEVLLGLLTR